MRLLTNYMYKQDARGSVTGLFNEFPLEELNLISTLAGSVRGNHYHQITREFFFILTGKLHLLVTDLNNQIIFNAEIAAGTLFMIDPNEIHTITAITDVSWINGLDKKFSELNPDFHILK